MEKICQSGGTPPNKEVLGTNANGGKNEEYRIYYHKNGAFTNDSSNEEMIERCLQIIDELHKYLKSKKITQEENKESE